MPRNKSPVDELLDLALKQAITPVLKPAGFRKKGMNFHRRRGETVQVVNVESSHGSTWEEKRLYINVGIAFDAICNLVGASIVETPKEYECEERGMRDRLESLIAGAPEQWLLRAGEDLSNTIEQLRNCMEQLVAELDQIDGPATYESHRWFKRFRAKQENAQLLYILGDLEGAWNEVKQLAALFADRENANRAEWWIETLNLEKLKARVDTDGTSAV